MRGVSKDRQHMRLRPSFEARPRGRAPQDDGSGIFGSKRKPIEMNSTAIAAPRLPLLLDSIPRKLIVALAVTGFADWLFYDQKIGISVAVFLLVLGGLSLLTNPVHAGCGNGCSPPPSFCWASPAVVEEFNVLSATLWPCSPSRLRYRR